MLLSNTCAPGASKAASTANGLPVIEQPATTGNRVHGQSWRAPLKAAAMLGLLLALAACGKDEPAAVDAPEQAAEPTQAAKVAAEPPAPAVSEQVAAMSAEELQNAASTALSEQRLYAPAGDNAMEYYLALRDKQPDNPAVASALTDLMPYTLIATEQSIAREDFEEASRLYALMEKADAKAPALPRLKQSIADSQAEMARRLAAEEQRSEEEQARAEELAQQRELEQQQAQAEAAAQLAQQQAEQEAAAQRAAEQRAAEQLAAQQQAEQATAPQEQASEEETEASSAGNTELVQTRSVPPQFPRQALRRRLSGSVVVEFVVGTDGSVTSARVVSSEPRQVFDNAALFAVRQWEFEPLASPITARRTIAFNPGG